jgi:hypothetical protein
MAAGQPQEDEFVTRREFDKLEHRVSDMDSNGTRGILVLQERITDMAKELVRLEAASREHEQQHAREAVERRNTRHWVMGTSIAAAVGLSTIIGMLVEVLRSIHP